MSFAVSIKLLCNEYCRGELTAEEYFAAVNDWARRFVEAEVAGARYRDRVGR